MKFNKLLPLLLVASISSCTQNDFVIEDKVFCFDTMVEYKLYEGSNDDKKEINNLLSYYDKISDNYKSITGLNNITSINNTNEDIVIDEKLYQLIKASLSTKEFGASNFNPLCGSLVKKWKEALEKEELLSQEIITNELEKINSSSIVFKDNNVIQRVGQAELDLGGIAKGYVLDEIKSYLSSKEMKYYLVNGGSSSILLGEKKSEDGLYNVGIDSRIIPNSYISVKNCFVSTSALNTQGKKIGDTTYSHIVNPITGSVINEQDAVIVVSSSGYVGDALSTSLMLNTLEEIKDIEKQYDFKCIVVKNKEVTYVSEGLEVKHR